MNIPTSAAPEKARPLAPVAVLLVVAAVAYALVVGCGGSSQESGTQSSSSQSTTETPAAQPAADTAAMAGDPLAMGKKVYMDRCALCHGTDGKGDGPAAAALNPKPRDHTDGAYMNSRTDEQLLEVIHNGKGGMPAWKGVLSEQEMQNVLKYVRTLAK
jgi:mono/diheme cytochrome c family protein